MKEQVKKQLQELDQKQQEFVQRIGDARDLLAELMFTSDAFFTLQKRELLHHMSSDCLHNPESRYVKEGIIFCNDCGNTLGFVEENIVAPLPFDVRMDLLKEKLNTISQEELTNKLSSYEKEPEFNYDLEKMKEAVDSPTILTLTGEHSQEEIRELLLKVANEAENKDLPKKINYCQHNDCGWCYASKDIATNAINGGCFEPQKCPANQG